MLDKLLDWIDKWFEVLLPWTVVVHYDRGIRLRYGKFSEVLEPGFHWKIPLVDDVRMIMVKTKTINLGEQNFTTSDWKSVVVKAVIKYEIDDPMTAYLEVNNPVDAVSDMTQGIIRDTLMILSWQECNGVDISKAITQKARLEAKRWGIRIDKITLTDMVEARAYRIFNSSITERHAVE